MSNEFDDNKTEAPTPQRREKAREDGQIVYSPDLNSSLAIFLVAIAAMWVVPTMTFQMQGAIRDRILHLDGSSWGPGATRIAVGWLEEKIWIVAGSAAIVFLGVNLLLTQLQTGFLITTKPLAPKWDKLDPVQGFQRLWSLDSVMRGFLATVKVLTLSAVTSVIFYVWHSTLQRDAHGNLALSIQVGWRMITQLMMALSGAALTWGLADYGFRWLRNEQKLRMTRNQVKDEQKEENGDPQVRAQIRRLQREASQRKSLMDVPQATVVITNPTHYAVALQYESGRMKAPRVVAKGSGAFARRIAETARKHGVPVLERKPLTRALYALADVGKEIPLEYFRAVAEILAHVYRLKNGR